MYYYESFMLSFAIKQFRYALIAGKQNLDFEATAQRDLPVTDVSHFLYTCHYRLATLCYTRVFYSRYKAGVSIKFDTCQ